MKATRISASISAPYLRARLSYDSATGIFVWLSKPGNDRLTNSWNARYAGTIAGCVEKNGYRYIKIDHIHCKASRLAWLWMTEQSPSNVIDHKNGDRADDRFCNLRDVTCSQNAMNKKPSGRSGLKGAYKANRRGRCKWQSWITAKGTTFSLGSFSSAEEAHAAYCEASARLHGEFGRVA